MLELQQPYRVFLQATRRYVTIYNRKPEIGEYHTHPIGKGSSADLENPSFEDKCEWLAGSCLNYYKFDGTKPPYWHEDSFVYTVVPDE